MNKKTEPLSIGKSIPLILAAIVFVAGISALAAGLDLCIWVIWLGMCLWSEEGMPFEIGKIVQIWSSGLAGIFMGYCLISGTQWGSVMGMICVSFFLVGMVTHRFAWICNNTTAVFLTVCTGAGLVLNPEQLAKSILFGFLVFGILPCGIKKSLSFKK